MIKPELVGIASRLETVRHEEDLSQELFAERLGISRGAYINYSKGGREIPSSLIVRLFDKFGVDPFWLVTGQRLEGINERDRSLIHASVKLGILFNRKIDPFNAGGQFERVVSSVEFALQFLVNDLTEVSEDDQKIVEYAKGLKS